MKISYRTQPILQKLNDGYLGKMGIIEEDLDFFKSYDWINNYDKIWKMSAAAFSSEILYVTLPFQEAAHKAGPKLIELYRDIVKSREVEIHFSGTIILSGEFSYTFHNEYNPETDHWATSVFCFMKDKRLDLPILLACADCVSKGENVVKDFGVPWHSWMSAYYRKIFNIYTIEREMTEISAMSGICVIMTMFKKYAEVETKYLKPNSKIKDEIGCKYINDTKLPVTWLDSKWFTNLVKSDAFKVRGHFRLQACGKDLKDHKIIWINDFMKTGYTSPARKIKQNHDSTINESV